MNKISVSSSQLCTAESQTTKSVVLLSANFSSVNVFISTFKGWMRYTESTSSTVYGRYKIIHRRLPADMQTKQKYLHLYVYFIEMLREGENQQD